MQLYDAKVADIVRCSQRDELFVDDVQNYILSLFKLFGAKNFNRLRRVAPVAANSWYYFLTTLSNLQTLGEEYAGVLRLNRTNKIPHKLLQILWLSLYIGGEPLFNRLLEHLQTNITTSQLQENAKNKILNFLLYVKNNKHILVRIHHSLFYMDGKYYNLSNRISGIKYVLLRQWMQDDTSSSSFKLLGKVSLLYLLFSLIQNYWSSDKELYQLQPEKEPLNSCAKLCILCGDNRKNTCATPCGHLYCWECIFDSLNYQQNCPICREEINPSRIVLLQNCV